MSPNGPGDAGRASGGAPSKCRQGPGGAGRRAQLLQDLVDETRRAISPFGFLADAPVPVPLAAALTDLDGYSLGQDPLMERLMEVTGCSDKTAKDAIRDAVDRKLITEEKAPKGSRKKKAYRLPGDTDGDGSEPGLGQETLI